MSVRLGLIVLLASSATVAAAAHGSSTKKSALDPAMQVHLVRSAQPGCEPQCPQWIAAQGRIDSASLGQFKRVLGKLGNHKIPILIDSGGGTVSDAMAIGRLIRAKGFDVVITATTFAPCAPSDRACRKTKTGGELRGLPQARLSKCASSCALVLAGGVRRLAGSGTLVGVHQITRIVRKYKIETRRGYGVVETKKTLISVTKVGQDNARVQDIYHDIRSYLANMGVSGDLMPLMESTPADKMRLLTATELRTTRLATHLINGEQLLNPAAVPPASVAPPMTSNVPLGLCSGSLGREWVAACADNKGVDDDTAKAPLELVPSVPPQVEK